MFYWRCELATQNSHSSSSPIPGRLRLHKCALVESNWKHMGVDFAKGGKAFVKRGGKCPPPCTACARRLPGGHTLLPTRAWHLRNAGPPRLSSLHRLIRLPARAPRGRTALDLCLAPPGLDTNGSLSPAQDASPLLPPRRKTGVTVPPIPCPVGPQGPGPQAVSLQGRFLLSCLPAPR